MIHWKSKGLFIVLVLFALIFSSVSIVNHYIFRTYAYDLGINNNAIYDYAHFRFNDCMLLQPQFKNLLSDHFSLLIIPVSFLYYITGSYTLILFQIFMILAGGVGVYIYFLEKFSNRKTALLAIIHFYVIWGVYGALAYDYHDNVIGTMLVPWLFVFLAREDLKKSAILILLIIVCKENVALWATFICLGLSISYRKNKRVRNFLLKASLTCIIYFVFIVKIVMPSFATENRQYLHFNFSAIGKSPTEIMENLRNNPALPLKLFFINQIHNPKAEGWEMDDIKLELYLAILFSGGLLWLRKPQFILMLVPVLLQKVYNDDVGKWGLNYHYCIEFVPILTLGAFTVLGEILNPKKQFIYQMVLVLATVFMTAKSLDSRKSLWYKGKNHRFYTKAHYVRDFDISDVYRTLDKIPANARLSAQSPIVPHVAFRDYIYLFPEVKDAEYIILNEMEDPYPYEERQAITDRINELKASPEWELFSQEGPVYLFKKK